MFDYYGRKKVAQQQSRKVIEKYADEYAKLTHKLNFTDAGLKELENELSELILQGTIKSGDIVEATVKEGKMAFEVK